MKKTTWADLTKHGRLGGGSFGDVFRATRKSVGDDVAVKVLRDVNNPLARAHLRREVEALMSFTHDGVVRILGYNLDEEPPFFIMPLMSGGALVEWAGKLEQPLLVLRPSALVDTPFMPRCGVVGQRFVDDGASIADRGGLPHRSAFRSSFSMPS
jgi:serine/threonine protein kinase